MILIWLIFNWILISNEKDIFVDIFIYDNVYVDIYLDMDINNIILLIVSK
jgi:hypothetical protein